MGGHQDDLELLRLAVESAPTGILVADADGQILLVNREVERLFDFTRDVLIGKPVEFLIPERFGPAHPSHRRGYVAAAVSRPMGAGRDLYGRRRDGSEVPVEIGLNPVRTERGLLILASVVDISARRQLEAHVRQAQRMEAIGALAGGIAHDFNNILLGIVGYTELARAALPGRGEVVADLDQVLAAAERGRLLVRRILTFSQERDVTRRVLRPEPLVREALTLLRATLPSNVVVREHLDPATPSVMADETEIHQVVMNLATNAAQAMGDGGGVIEVTLVPFQVTADRSPATPELRPGLHALLRVSDNGPGMPPEVVERAFEPFFTTKAPDRGTGLGLAMVHGIVKSYGGTATITSSPGGGTTVEILLPSADATRLAIHPEASEPGQGHRILLVEDEVTLAEMERRLLVGLGYVVTVYNSSLEALEAFRARPEAYDLMVTDNSMPHMTGLELAQEVVRLRPNLPVLMVSGLGEALKPEDLSRQGVSRVLRKPHRLSELSEALDTLLGGR